MSDNTMNVSPIRIIVLTMISLSLPACNTQKVEHHREAAKVVVASPQTRAVTITQQYVCQIRSQRHIKIRSLVMGLIEAIPVSEGKAVKQGDLMFKIKPTRYQPKRDVELADEKLAQQEAKYTKRLYQDKVDPQNELIREAKEAKDKAKSQQVVAELNAANITAPFDGIVDSLLFQQGSIVEEAEVLATLSDNTQMWAYFNVHETQYLEFMTDPNQRQEDLQIELVLTNGKKFEQLGKIGAIQSDFNIETGNIPFRADFPNPDRLLRHGQTGTVLISRVQNDALVVPQQAVFELFLKRYVYVVNKENVARQREVVIQNEFEDFFVIKSGIGLDDKIIVEGTSQVRDGEKVDCEDRGGQKR